jgi:hypothetical protein
MNNGTQAGSSALRLFIYWTVVGVPLVWGIWTTVLKLKALFG